MATRTTQTLGTPGFVADPESVRLSTGRQVDWESVAAGRGGELPAGIIVVEVADKIIPRADADSGPAYGILLTHASEDSDTDALTGYGVAIGGHFYENLLAEADDSAFADYVAELSVLFTFEDYEDTRAS